jgi:hypothetical protein
LRHWAHLLVDEGCAANLNIDCTEGPEFRRAAIVGYGRCSYGRRMKVAYGGVVRGAVQRGRVEVEGFTFGS